MAACFQLNIYDRSTDRRPCSQFWTVARVERCWEASIFTALPPLSRCQRLFTAHGETDLATVYRGSGTCADRVRLNVLLASPTRNNPGPNHDLGPHQWPGSSFLLFNPEPALEADAAPTSAIRALAATFYL